MKKQSVLSFLALIALVGIFVVGQPRMANAFIIPTCDSLDGGTCTMPPVVGPVGGSCSCVDTCAAAGCFGIPGLVQLAHAAAELLMQSIIDDLFDEQREWLMEDFFAGDPAAGAQSIHLLRSLQLFAQQLSVVGMHQVMTVGMFMDARRQMEVQRLYETLRFQAHRDYEPSESFCDFGTNMRSLAASEHAGKFNAAVLASRQMNRQLGNENTLAAEGEDLDKAARWRRFTYVYCDPQDNNWEVGPVDTGLILACGGASDGALDVDGDGSGDPDWTGDPARVNRDVDYTRLIEEPRTLDVSYQSNFSVPPPVPTTALPPSADEEDVMALAENLFGHKVLSRALTPSGLRNREHQSVYMALRTVAAKRSVAQNSFNAIVGMKSSGTSDDPAGTPATEPRTREFLAAVLTELGVPATEVFNVIGQEPSYYAQLEILAKKIYQNPNFYADLYDKPANVARKSVALRAIELMLDRAIYESQLRREMATSVLLSTRLGNSYSDVNDSLGSARGIK